MHKLSISKQLGHHLSSRRKALGLTQQYVASRLGIGQSRLSELENEPAQLTLERLLAWAGILGLEIGIQERPSTPTESEW